MTTTLLQLDRIQCLGFCDATCKRCGWFLLLGFFLFLVAALLAFGHGRSPCETCVSKRNEVKQPLRDYGPNIRPCITTIINNKTKTYWTLFKGIICCCGCANQVAFSIKPNFRKIMSKVSGTSCNTDFCNQQEARKQRQRIALGCNPQKQCILKCGICAEESRKAEEQTS